MYMVQAECEFIRLVFISSHLIFLYLYIIWYFIIFIRHFNILFKAVVYTLYCVSFYLCTIYMIRHGDINNYTLSLNYLSTIMCISLWILYFFHTFRCCKVWIFYIYPHLLVNLIVDNGCFTWNIFAVLWINYFSVKDFDGMSFIINSFIFCHSFGRKYLWTVSLFIFFNKLFWIRCFTWNIFVMQKFSCQQNY